MATSCAVSSRFACVSSSARDAHTNKRDAVQRVDRPVRDDRPRPERNRALPREDERPERCSRCAATQFAKPYVRKKKGPRKRSHATARREMGSRPRDVAGSAMSRRASETVKMPHSSMRCVDLAKARGRDQLVQLHLRAAPHDPRAAAVAREAARDELELRMPRLAGVDEEAVGLRSRRRVPRATRAASRCPGKSSYRPDTMPIVGRGASAARLARSNASPCSNVAIASRRRWRISARPCSTLRRS